MCIGKHHSMARIDGSKRSSGLPLRPALAASAVRAFAVRRVSRLSQLGSAPSAGAHRPPLGRSVDNSRACRRMLLRAARRLFPFDEDHSPALCTKSTVIASDRILYSRCGPKKVREQFVLRRAARAAARAAPGPAKIASRESAGGVAYAPRARPLTAATHR